MYQNKFVIAIKVNGRILRESDAKVHIPFGSEYAVLVKNLNASRAKFKLDIDGKNATSDAWIVVGPNSSVTMERFIEDGNWERGRRFKFIERTAEIEAHRGERADDGLVRIEYQVEVVRPVVPVPRYEPYPVPYPEPWYPRWPYQPLRRWSDLSNATRSVGASSTRSKGVTYDSSFTACNFVSQSGAGASADAGEAVTDSCDIGITVAGSESHQRFHAVSDFQCGQSEVMVLHLLGTMAGRTVSQPLTVDAKLTCSSCGKESDSRSEFCSRCGTALVA